jgi:hypothetical protein
LGLVVVVELPELTMVLPVGQRALVLQLVLMVDLMVLVLRLELHLGFALLIQLPPETQELIFPFLAMLVDQVGLLMVYLYQVWVARMSSLQGQTSPWGALRLAGMDLLGATMAEEALVLVTDFLGQVRVAAMVLMGSLLWSCLHDEKNSACC